MRQLDHALKIAQELIEANITSVIRISNATTNISWVSAVSGVSAYRRKMVSIFTSVKECHHYFYPHLIVVIIIIIIIIIIIMAFVIRLLLK